MARMLLSLEGVVIKEVFLVKDHTTFGRRPYSDVVIDNLAISGEHAVVHLQNGEVVIEDMQSTNGTFVNGLPISRHVLQDGDVAEIGKYQLKFEQENVPFLPAGSNGQELNAESFGTRKDRQDTPIFAETTLPSFDTSLPQPAVITVLSGAASGREVQLTKVVTTIGKSGVGIASITRRPHGFSLAHVEGAAQPTVNGTTVGSAPVLLHHGDLLELAGIRMQFMQTAG